MRKSKSRTSNQIGLTSSPDFVAGISVATLSRLEGHFARQCRAEIGCFGAFSGILSLFCPKYLRRRESTRLRKKDVAWGHSGGVSIVTIKHTHCLYTYILKLWRISKMKENQFMLEAACNTPHGNEYSKQNHQSMSRRTLYYSRSGVVLTRRNYSVGGMTYQVNSFFCPSRCPSADEGLRRLMQQEIENNS